MNMRCLGILLVVLIIASIAVDALKTKKVKVKRVKGTVKKGSGLWKQMGKVIMDLTQAFNAKDVPRTMALYTEHSWVMPPGHVGIIGRQDNKIFIKKMFKENAKMQKTTLTEVGGNRRFAWARGAMVYNDLNNLWAITCEKVGKKWKIHLFNWSPTVKNSPTALKALFFKEAKRTAAEADDPTHGKPIPTKRWRGTVKNDTALWKEMHQLAMDLSVGITDQDFPLTISLYNDHSWIQPPSHVFVTGFTATEDFIRVLFAANTKILKTTLFEVGGNNKFAWSRGSTEVNGFESFFCITCDKIKGKWITNLLAWAISADNPTPAFKAVLEQQERKAAAEAAAKASAKA